MFPAISSHSFGYDCQKRSNLLMLDTHTCVFAAGNVVQLLNLQTKEQRYLRSTSGGGIGALAVSFSFYLCFLFLPIPVLAISKSVCYFWTKV